MTRFEIKNLISEHSDNPQVIFSTMLRDANLEDGFLTLLQSPFPMMMAKELIAVIQDIIDNDRQFYYSTADVPRGAKYICDVGVCDACKLYVK